MSKKVCEISILGNKYTIKSEETQNRVKEIEDYVNQQLQEVLKKSKSLSVQNATILAALNIAGEYFKLKEQQQTYHNGVLKRSKEVLGWIDNQLKNVKGSEPWV
ncbi:MAG: cell division protein ZapA [Deltaproteobacteria bacterium]|nr:cell division protein ZapA [Deltaproteobacteria bacterium]